MTFRSVLSNTVPSPESEAPRYWGEHALWVGNIPQDTTIMSLRDYFSEASPQELLSISYNPDAKYAFVNYSTESSRVAAIRHAASRMFQGRRLDCRIRQDSTSRSTKVNYGLNQSRHRQVSISANQSNDLWNKVEEFSHFPEADRAQWGMEKFFIVKSFSIEALSKSLESNQWYVPRRHIDRLNHAFQVGALQSQTYPNLPSITKDLSLTLWSYRHQARFTSCSPSTDQGNSLAMQP